MRAFFKVFCPMLRDLGILSISRMGFGLGLGIGLELA